MDLLTTYPVRLKENLHKISDALGIQTPKKLKVPEIQKEIVEFLKDQPDLTEKVREIGNVMLMESGRAKMNEVYDGLDVPTITLSKSPTHTHSYPPQQDLSQPPRSQHQLQQQQQSQQQQQLSHSASQNDHVLVNESTNSETMETDSDLKRKLFGCDGDDDDDDLSPKRLRFLNPADSSMRDLMKALLKKEDDREKERQAERDERKVEREERQKEREERENERVERQKEREERQREREVHNEMKALMRDKWLAEKSLR